MDRFGPTASPRFQETVVVKRKSVPLPEARTSSNLIEKVVRVRAASARRALRQRQAKLELRMSAASASVTMRCMISATGRISLIPPAVWPAVSNVS
jgi:hypothetical protein